MAVYFDLAIDCGTEESLAEKIEEFFSNLIIEVPELPPVACRAYAINARNLWFVSVWPEGLGYATHPVCRPELVTEINLDFIKDQLYHELKKFRGFRRALFGGEAFDCFSEASKEDDNDLEFTDLVFSSTEFPNPPKNLLLAPFSEGYWLVVDKQ
jgi:hypothetical protein